MDEGSYNPISGLKALVAYSHFPSDIIGKGACDAWVDGNPVLVQLFSVILFCYSKLMQADMQQYGLEEFNNMKRMRVRIYDAFHFSYFDLWYNIFVQLLSKVSNFQCIKSCVPSLPLSSRGPVNFFCISISNICFCISFLYFKQSLRKCLKDVHSHWTLIKWSLNPWWNIYITILQVELEKLRLLCERIIKREKVKVCVAPT